MSNHRNKLYELFLDGPSDPLSYILLIVFSFVAFGQSVRFDYTYLDDQALILQNLHFLTHLQNLPRLFLEDLYLSYTDAYYRPMLSLSLMIDALVWGPDPLGYHLSNVVYHAVAVCLVYRFLDLLLGSKRSAFLLGALFAVHPVHNQSVSWIPGRCDVELLIFTLLALIPCLRREGASSVKSVSWSSAWFLIALFTKETAFVIIPLLAAAVVLLRRRVSPLKMSVGYGIALVIYLWMRSLAFTKPIPLDPKTMLASVWVGSPALLQFLGKTIFPFHLSVLPSIPDTPFVWGALALVLLCIVGFKTGNRAVYAFGCIWFIIFILPSFLRPETYTVPYFLEHRLYLPLLGVLLMAGSYPPLFRERKSHAVAFLLVLALFTGITIWNGRFYRDRTAYWTRAVETAPRQPIGYKNLGNVYYMEGRFEEAERYYLETLRLNRYEPMVYNNLGLIHAYRDEFGPAKEDFIKALQMDPNYVDAWYHLGLLYASTGDSSLMVQSWEKALSLHPDHVGALVQMCRYCLRKGDREGYGIYLDRLHRLRIELPSDLSE